MKKPLDIDSRVRWQRRFRIYLVVVPIVVTAAVFTTIAAMFGFNMRGPEVLSMGLVSVAVGVASVNALYMWKSVWMNKVILYETHRLARAKKDAELRIAILKERLTPEYRLRQSQALAQWEAHLDSLEDDGDYAITKGKE